MDKQATPKTLDSKSQVRDYLFKALKRDLVGPSWKEGTTEENPVEVLNLQRNSPYTYYFCGYISPAKAEESKPVDDEIQNKDVDLLNSKEEELPPEKFNGESANSSEEDLRHINSRISPGNSFSPRSIGLTVKPSDLSGHPVLVNLTWGQYDLADKDGDMRTWVRSPYEFEYEINESLFKNQREHRIDIEGSEGLELFVKRGIDDETITIRMVNNRVYSKSEHLEAACGTVHQPVIQLSSIFSEVRSPDVVDNDKSMALLYSDSSIYAKGHNVGVNWEDNSSVWTEFLPSFEVPVMKADSSLDDLIPTMDEFSNPETVIVALNKMKQFMKRYREWSASESIRFSDYDPSLFDHYEDIFDKHMGHVDNTISRISDGIEYLKNNEIAREAFVLANKAINISQTDSRLTDTYRIDNFKWRPFQICFQLLNIKGLLSKGGEEKEIVDLAWFPTGGGKTEAYLGLLAVCSFYRRLDPETVAREIQSPGVHSIMRYTLRLLTADQSARLVRACGAMNIVADEHGIGEESGFTPFRVGMWIGSETSPNNFFKNPNYPKNNTTQDVIDKAKALEESGDCTVVQFPTCPWCGDESVGDASRYEITTPDNSPAWAKKRPILSVKCASSGCAFEHGVPFTCVDEDIYLNPPSILLGTADKFAQLAFNPTPSSVENRPEYNLSLEQLEDYDARRLMGFDSSRGGPLPPSLIIQDELHLLTGPLGTIAGLVECALDVAWKHTCDGHRIKYVAATATIRGAENDASLMYGRSLNIFPPPLLTIKDNFFAKEISKEEARGRLHVGIIAPQGKARTLLNNPSASLLQNISTIREKSEVKDEDLDPYWTLVLYYNSLRELGGGQSSLRKNIPQMIRLFAQHSDSKPRELYSEKELTSRKTGEELSIAKEHLEFDLLSGKNVVDVVSTSNMFQVGIDIGRLGLMSIVGQPRSNSEYIQSSGRVGRKHPGMVLSLLKGNYPRDQSHYELFRAFHQEIYSHVDHTSITPFSHRALDRAFASTMMLLLRSSIRQVRKTKDLTRIMNGDCRVRGDEIISEFIQEINRRQRQRGMSEQIISEGENIINEKWDGLKRFVRNAKEQEKVTWWIVWNDRQRMNIKVNQPLSWLKSPFRTTNNPNNEDYEDGLGSFRDVAEETEISYVPPQDDTKPYASGSMPESHLFSHMAPGFIWEKGGVPYLTLGISRWNNDISVSKDKKHHMAAFNGKNEIVSGLRIAEPALNQILGINPEGKQRVLRSVPPYKDGNKQYGAINVTKYPTNYICEDGHVHYGVIPKDGESTCRRLGCGKPTSPSRFVSICDNGHLSAFNYNFWAHSNDNDYDKPCRKLGSKARIKLVEGENSAYTLADWVVICEECGAKNSMEKVPWVEQTNKRYAPKCHGHRPWLASSLNAKEECNLHMVHRQVGNVSVSYSQGSSVLLIPPDVSFSLANDNNIQRLLRKAQEESQSFDEFKDKFHAFRDIMGDPVDLSGTYFDDDDDPDAGPNWNKFLRVLWDYKNKHMDEDFLTLKNLRGRERNGIIDSDVENNSIDTHRFDKTSIAGNFGEFPVLWENEDWPLRGATRINRLTELKYILGIDRLDPKEGNFQPIDHPETRGNTPDEEFGIGMYNFGEGLFFDLKPQWLTRMKNQRDSNLEKVSHRDMSFSNEDNRLRNVKHQIPALSDPKNNSAFTILHTLSHALIRELAMSSGFSLGSIRERLYFDVDENDEIIYCGILLYTSGPSSDGTLGGLVRRGSSTYKIQKLVEEALKSLRSCSNDPVCSDHHPNIDEPNGAACHSCVLLPETSCELANHLLDRNWGW